MISYLSPLPIGNAVRCLLAPAEGATSTRVLRKPTNNISGPTDPAAAVVYEDTGPGFVDIASLENGTRYYYQAFDFIGNAWVASGTAMGVTPAATAESAGPDPFTLLRDRLEDGLKAEVAAGRLKHETGKIPVLLAPPTYDNTKWPVVSMTLPNDGPQERGIGELLAGDVFDPAVPGWLESEGWLSATQIQVTGWSLNADERHDLRKALKKIVIGNLPVFADQGLLQVGFSQSTADDMESYATPVYSTPCTFTCLAPSAVQDDAGVITDVTVAAI